MFTNQEIQKLTAYLQQKFKNPGFTIKPRDKANDSVEVLLNDEFIAVIYKDTDEGETSYDMNMAILDIDLESAA